MFGYNIPRRGDVIEDRQSIPKKEVEDDKVKQAE